MYTCKSKIHRFLAICFPLDWHMSRRMARWVIACIWIFSLSISLPWALYFTLHSYPLDNQTIQVCAEEWPSEQMDRIYFICANLILLYLFPATVIILCYLGIWYKIERRNIPGDQPPGLKIELIMQKSKLKVVKMMMVVVIMFLLSWLPTYLIFARIKLKDERGADEEWLIAKVMPLAQWLGASNSCINPILYTFFNRKYKRSFFDLLRFAFCCKPLMKTSGLTAEGQGYTIANKARGGNGQMRENGLSMVPLNLNHSGGPSDGGGVADNGGGSANGAGRQSNISTTSLAISGTSAQDNITSESIEATARSPAEACQIDTLHVHRSRNSNVKYGHHCGRDYAHRHHRHQHNHRHRQQPQQQQLQQRQQLLQHNHFNNNKATSSCNRRNHSNLWSKDNILVERDNNSVDSDTLVLRGHCSSSSRQQFIGGDTSPRAHQRQLPKTLSSKNRAKADRLGSSDKRVLSGADGDSSASGQHLELKQGPSRSRHRRRHHHIGCPRRREQHQIRSQSGSGRDDRLEQALERLVTPCDELDGLRQVELVAEHLDSECGFLQQ